ncbi:MAG: DUF6364 family protein [Trueperaceae bacterium]|nr:DUF6364 family protein [Trueperaceae bacterium]
MEIAALVLAGTGGGSLALVSWLVLAVGASVVQIRHALWWRFRRQSASGRWREASALVAPSGRQTYVYLLECTYEEAAMKSKLTLRLDDDVVRRAKRYAKDHGTSLSRMVEGYFDAIGRDEDGAPARLTPRVHRLLGALERADVDEHDYKDHLIEKHS